MRRKGGQERGRHILPWEDREDLPDKRHSNKDLEEVSK